MEKNCIPDGGNGVPKGERNSSIELLKIIAMFLIVISHVAQTLGSPHPELSYPAEIFFDAMHTAHDVQHFVILVFRHFGAFGNLLFFICSAWFLCGSRKPRTQRIIQIFADVWTLSVLSLIAAFAVGFRPSWKEVIKLLFPTTFEINWYTTCYVCFLAVFPLLNTVIGYIGKSALLKVCFVLSVVYLGLNCVSARFYYYNNLMLFITIYFVVAYVKLYAPQVADNVRLNRGVFFGSLILLFLLILATNALSFKSAFFGRNALHWARNNNPLLLLAAFSLFNLFRQCTFCNRIINYVSSLTLFIYLIHDGLIVRKHLRPWMWFELHERFGYSQMAALTLAFSLCLFVAAIVVSVLYKETICRLTGKAARAVHRIAGNVFR